MILLLMQSRSGSSLVASIFDAHGFDCGNDSDCAASHFGYKTYENSEVKRWIKAHKGAMRFKRGQFVDFVPGVAAVVPENACVKIGIEYWPLFAPIEPKVFCVRRDLGCIAQSLADKRGTKPERVRPLIDRRNDLLDRARDFSEGVDVSSDEIVQGDFAGLADAFRHHGLDFDADKARGCVDPDKWHYPSSRP